MKIDVAAISGEIKDLPPDTREFLQAAYDGGDPEQMAMGIIAHPSSLELNPQTISRLFVIGFMHGLPAPTEVQAMRTIAGLLLDMEARQ